VAGSAVTLIATATNTSGVEQSLDGIGFTFVSPFADYDDSPFFQNWPLTLDAAGPGSVFGPAAMFTVLIPLGTPAGLYSGNLVNVYGGGGGSLLLTAQPFDIQVASGTSIPEPTTACLLACGLTAVGLFRYRRKQKQRLPVRMTTARNARIAEPLGVI
jgi:hypothetical protein